MSFIIGSLVACNAKNTYYVDKFTDSDTNNCIIVTSAWNENDNYNGVYCKANLTQ